MIKSGLGRAIQNKIDKKQRMNIGSKAPVFYQQTQQNQGQLKKQKMKSVIQQNSLSQFLQIAELSQQNFKANRDIKFSQIREQVRQKKIIMIDNKQVLLQDQIDQEPLRGLQMPRRPNWKDTKSKKQLEQKQSEAYLNWRRNLGKLEQSNVDIRITPYQKNVEVWRQLWRVTERADLMVQIVDGRDPLFFRSEDLMSYIKQLDPNKKSLLLINKSDLVSQQIRKRWNKYFIEHNIAHIFFSAKIPQVQQEQESQSQLASELQSQITKQTQIIHNQEQLMQAYFNKPQIIKTEQLKQLFNCYAGIINKQNIEVGMVGYPNVGKSSIINALFGKKRVGVASMPGKTKHFQTLKLTDKVMLCDCPGLVFPRISSSHAYMILNGLYSIDTLKYYYEPIKIIIQRVPQKLIEQVYSLLWKENQIYDEETLLAKYSQMKGVFAGNGLPNQSYAARHILKDYVNGVIVYARNPPGLTGEQIQSEQKLQNSGTIKQSQFEQQSKAQMTKAEKAVKNLQNEIDGQFFKNETVQKISEQDAIRQLTQDDLLDIMQGRKIDGMRITKQVRKNIKHAMKRGQNLAQIKKSVFGHKQTALYKHCVKNQ